MKHQGRNNHRALRRMQKATWTQVKSLLHSRIRWNDAIDAVYSPWELCKWISNSVKEGLLAPSGY